jgi:hypothetical protein
LANLSKKTFLAHVIFKSNNYSIRTQKKVSKKTKKKTIPKLIPASEPVPIPVSEPTDITRSKSITRRAIHRRAIHSIGCFMKHAVCEHILGYIYRHTKLDQECWFGFVCWFNYIL